MLAPERDEENWGKIQLGSPFIARDREPLFQTLPVSGHMCFSLKAEMELPLPHDLPSLRKGLGFDEEFPNFYIMDSAKRHNLFCLLNGG